MAAKIAERAPIAVQMAKQAIDSGDAYAAMEQVGSAATAFTEDAAEGFASFTEKRNPQLPRDLNLTFSTDQHRTKALAMTTITSTAPTTITANIWPNIIDGREVGGGGEEVLRDSPAHDIRVASYRSASEADVDAAVTAAHRAFSSGDWPRDLRCGEGRAAAAGRRAD